MPEPTRSRVCETTKDSAALFAPTKRLCIPIERAEYDRIWLIRWPFARIWTVRLPLTQSYFRQRLARLSPA